MQIGMRTAQQFHFARDLGDGAVDKFGLRRRRLRARERARLKQINVAF